MALNKDWRDLPLELEPQVEETFTQWRSRINAYNIANPGILTPLTAAAMEDLETRVQAELNSKLTVGASAVATTLGTIVRKIEVFDGSGQSLGFVPVYGTIT